MSVQALNFWATTPSHKLMTRKYGLIGKKLSHSYSPDIHKAFGLADYELFELHETELEDFIKHENMGGFNVTIPYKLAVMDYCDVLSDTAKDIGSVNTIFRRDGKIYGDNTDVFGLAYTFNIMDVSFKDKKVMILGTGGASKTAEFLARRENAREIVLVTRTGTVNFDDLSEHFDSEIIINATPVGMYPNNGECKIMLSNFTKCEAVMDMVYNPARTKLIMQAETLGIKHSDGLRMLVAQAMAAQDMFLGKVTSIEKCEKVIKSIRSKMENLVLIGMPSCGKSSLGVGLSKISMRELVDIDEKIVEHCGKSIEEIFSEGGESLFREYETEVLNIFCKESGKIIVTGGGVVTRGRNYEILHQNSKIYHIERDVKLLETVGRPLSRANDLHEMYEIRLPMYEKFRDEVFYNEGSIEDLATAIWRDFSENISD